LIDSSIHIDIHLIINISISNARYFNSWILEWFTAITISIRFNALSHFALDVNAI